ncbi:MAG: sulfite exporter TauE/SafE family protein [Bacteroidota bacterium]
MPWSEIVFYALLFAAAFLYSSVGHGGASGYLAIMALYHFAPAQMKPTALCLNLFVSMIAFLQFRRAGHFKWPLFWPLAAASIPMAFIGGSIQLNDPLYRVILGIVLLIIVLRFVFIKNVPGDIKVNSPAIGWLLLLGGLIGFLSGLIGIGGGVLLSPVILLCGWAGQKQTASISALFIFVNSAAGLAGQLLLNNSLPNVGSNIVWLILIGVSGSLMGSYLGAKKFNIQIVKYLLSVVLVIAAYHLIWK